MGTRIELFCKFTRKTEIGLEEGFVGWWWTLLRSGPRRGRGRGFEGRARGGGRGPAFAGRAFARIWDVGFLMFSRGCGTRIAHAKSAKVGKEFMM